VALCEHCNRASGPISWPAEQEPIFKELCPTEFEILIVPPTLTSLYQKSRSLLEGRPAFSLGTYLVSSMADRIGNTFRKNKRTKDKKSKDV
jgi:hypothetical protein